MIIIGLDPGIALTGFGILDSSSRDSFVSCGCLTTPKRDDVPYRLLQLGEDALELIDKYKPEVAAVEKIFFNSNSKTAMLTAQARGVLLYVLTSKHIPVYSLTPLQIKSKLTGFGRADKKQVQLVVQKRLKLDKVPQPDDAADALAAALCLAG